MSRPSRTPIPYSDGKKFLYKNELNIILYALNIKYKYQKIETEYENLYNIFDRYYNKISIYRFNTSFNKLFDLMFYNVDTDHKIMLNNETSITDIVDEKILNESIDNTYDISLITTLENRYFKEYHGHNKKECNEIIRKLSYLINEFIKDNPEINIYVIGKNIDLELLERYKEVFGGIFSDGFEVFEGTSKGYTEGAIYFINKKVLKPLENKII